MVIGLGGNSTNFIQVVYVNSCIENPWLAKVVEAIEQCYLRSNVYHKNEQKNVVKYATINSSTPFD